MKKKHPYIDTKFNKNTDIETVNIIVKYWEINNGTFEISPTELRTQLGISQPALNKIVKSNSESILYLDKCVECTKPIKIDVTAQSKAKSLIENNSFQCKECRIKFEKKNEHLDYKEKNLKRVEYAMKYKLWEKLKPYEFDVLRRITQASDSSVYTDNPKYSSIVAKLDRLKLIDVTKNEFDRIVKVNFSSDLNKVFIKEKAEMKPKNHHLEYAIKNEFWKKLTAYEFDVLKTIVRLNNYSKIYQELYKGKEKFEKNWKIIEKLDRLGLIEIKRNISTNKITKFHFLQELVKILDVNTNFRQERLTNLSFNVPRKFNRNKETQPHFTRKIIFGENITLEPDVEYICSLWKNSDGSIDFKLTPSSEISNNNQKVHREKFNSEPKRIGDIIKKITGK